MDFVIRSVHLSSSDGPVDIAVAGGRIARIAPTIACDAPEVDGAGRFACAGLTETHIHLDKAGIIGRCALCTGTLAEAVAETAKAKAAFTEDDVYARAAHVVEQAVLHGTNRVRTFVEIDPRAGFRSFEALKRIRADYAALIDVELCAFAQEGLTNEPETEAMLDVALGDGADLVGGCPYTDPHPVEHIRRIFDLAQRHGVNVDFHIDFDLHPAGSNLPAVIAETRARGYEGRVSVGHATKLSAMAPDEVEAMGRALARAGIAVTVLPATDLFLNGRGADRLVPRGVAPAHRLAALGVLTSIASNNILNPFTPFGDASLMRMANLYANLAPVATSEGLEAIFAMVADDAARLLGRPAVGLREGAPADIVLLDAASGADAVARIAPATRGWKAGRPTFVRPAPQLFLGA